jgi:hypothetical protein
MSSQHRLSDTELAEVVQRAVEIQELQTRLDPIENDLDDYVKAAEEMAASLKQASSSSRNRRTSGSMLVASPISTRRPWLLSS